MILDLLARGAALIAVLSTAVVYGTDVFCAIARSASWPPR
jgi:hypothetical protein